MADEEQGSNINDDNFEGDELPNVPLDPLQTLQQQEQQSQPPPQAPPQAPQPQDQDKYTLVRNIIDWFRQNFIVGNIINETQAAEQARALLTIIHEQMSMKDATDKQFLRDNFDLGPLSRIDLSSQFVMHLALNVRAAPSTRKETSVKRVEGTPVLNVYGSNNQPQSESVSSPLQPQQPAQKQPAPSLNFIGEARPLYSIKMSYQTARICHPRSS
jgi:hypothetical protein